MDGDRADARAARRSSPPRVLTRRIAPPLYGGLTLLGLTALGVYTALSITWSLAPADSWLETSRTFAYVAAFAGALALVRLVPGRWAAVLNGIGLGCVLVCAWALLTKVFPEALAPDETFARLREPFGYWNAVGLMAALGVPPLLWLAARRTGPPLPERARLAGARAAVRLHDAVLLARRAAGARRSGSRSGSPSCRCGCAPRRRCWRRRWPPRRSSRGRSRATRSRPSGSRSPRAPTPATSSARCCCWSAPRCS